MHDLARTPLEGHYDVFVHEEFSSLGCNYVIPIPTKHSYVSLTGSQPSLSPEYYFEAPIENPMFSDSNVDLGREENMFNMLSGNVLILGP